MWITSIFRNLSKHPEVCGLSVKETRYFLDKEYFLFTRKYNYYTHGMRGYNDYFQNCHRDHKVVLEPTPDYIYQKLSLYALKMLPRAPVLLFLLRRPSERVYSLFNYAKNNMAVLAKDVTFRQYVNKIKNRFASLNGKDVLGNAIDHSRYYRYLKRWRKEFGTNIVLLLTEDLKNDPPMFMTKLAQRLGVEPSFYDEFILKKINHFQCGMTN